MAVHRSLVRKVVDYSLVTILIVTVTMFLILTGFYIVSA